MKKKKFNPKKELKEAQSYISYEYEYKSKENQPEAKLRKFLKTDSSIITSNDIVGYTGDVALLEENIFCENIYLNKQKEAKESPFFDYLFYTPRLEYLRIIHPHPENKGYIMEEDALLLFSLALTFKRMDEGRWLGRIIYQSALDHFQGPPEPERIVPEMSQEEFEEHGFSKTQPTVIIREGFTIRSESPYCGFVLRLHSILAGLTQPEEPLPKELPSAGVYEDLFTNWHKPDKLPEAIIKACDFHVERSYDHHAYDNPEFYFRPYKILPIELFALQTVREEMGLETPIPKHPLIDSPFAQNLPRPLPKHEGELYQKVIALTKKFYPDFEDYRKEDGV